MNKETGGSITVIVFDAESIPAGMSIDRSPQPGMRVSSNNARPIRRVSFHHFSQPELNKSFIQSGNCQIM